MDNKLSFEQVVSVNRILYNSEIKVMPSLNDDGSFRVYVEKREPTAGIFPQVSTLGIISNVKSPADILEGLKNVANAQTKNENKEVLWDAVAKVSANFSVVKNPDSVILGVIDKRFQALEVQTSLMNNIMKQNDLPYHFIASRTEEDNVYSMGIHGKDKGSITWYKNIRNGKDAIDNLSQIIEETKDEHKKSELKKVQDILTKNKEVNKCIDDLANYIKKYDNYVTGLKTDELRSQKIIRQILKENTPTNFKVEIPGKFKIGIARKTKSMVKEIKTFVQKELSDKKQHTLKELHDKFTKTIPLFGLKLTDEKKDFYYTFISTMKEMVRKDRTVRFNADKTAVMSANPRTFMKNNTIQERQRKNDLKR